MSYVNRVQSNGAKVDVHEVLQNIRKISEKAEESRKAPKKKRQLSIDVEKIEEEYFG